MSGAEADVRARADELRAHRVPFVAATVVRAERPTSAKPGDTALVLADGTVTGFVGGECAETSVQFHAIRALASGEPVLLRVTPDLNTEPAPAAGVVTVHNPCLSGGALEIFLEPQLPPPLVLVLGDAPIARSLVAVGRAMGYEVTASPDEGVPPGAVAVVVASHGRDEAETLTAALRAGVPYVGLVASRQRGAAVLTRLDATDADRARIHTPAGLDIGARTPAEVALSILAEIVSTRPRPPSPATFAAAGLAPVVVADAIDPVCGMGVAAVETALHIDHSGARYWFCGSGCRQAFAADPGAFVPA